MIDFFLYFALGLSNLFFKQNLTEEFCSRDMKIFCILPLFTSAQEFEENSGSIRLEAPALDSEEGGNWHIAPHLVCDACRIISAEINKRMNFEINKVKNPYFD